MLYFTCMANVSEVARQRLIELARLEPEDLSGTLKPPWRLQPGVSMLCIMKDPSAA